MWKSLFTASSLRNLAPVFYEITQRQQCTEDVTEIDLAMWESCVSLEMIAVGYSFDNLAVGGEPGVYGAKMKKTTATMSTPLARLGMKYLPMFPSLKTREFNRFLLNHIPSVAVRDLKKFIGDLDRITKDLFAMKKAELLKSDGRYSVGNGETEKDLIGTLISNNVLPDTSDRIREDGAISHNSRVCGYRLLLFISSMELFPSGGKPRYAGTFAGRELNAKEDPDLSFDQLQNSSLLDAVYLEMLCLYTLAQYFYRLSHTALLDFQVKRLLPFSALTDTVVPLAVGTGQSGDLTLLNGT